LYHDFNNGCFLKGSWMALPGYLDVRIGTGIHPVVAAYMKHYIAQHGHAPGRKATVRALEASGISPHAVQQSWRLLRKDAASDDETSTPPEED
jgi:hypothetical protein